MSDATHNCDTPNCPACGSAETARYNWGDPCQVIDYACGSRRQGDGYTLSRTERCRLNVAERRNAELERQLAAVNEEPELNWPEPEIGPTLVCVEKTKFEELKRQLADLRAECDSMFEYTRHLPGCPAGVGDYPCKCGLTRERGNWEHSRAARERTR